MNKKFIFILTIAAFFGAQTMALSHAAEHVFEDHNHQTQICQICLSISTDNLAIAANAQFDVVGLVKFKTQFLAKKLPIAKDIQSFNSRAPPFFS
jgi:hypothetical protein